MKKLTYAVLVDLVTLEVMQRILTVRPPKHGDSIPDPGKDFEGCIHGVLRTLIHTLATQQPAARRTYLHNRVTGLIFQLENRKAPVDILDKARKLLQDVEEMK